MKRYRISDGIEGKIIEATSAGKALALAMRWIKETVPPDNDFVLRCSVSAKEIDEADQPCGEFAHDIILAYPNHRELVRLAGGNPDCNHSWIDPHDTDEGRVIVYNDRCESCGIRRRRTVVGWGKGPNQADRYEYSVTGWDDAPR